MRRLFGGSLKRGLGDSKRGSGSPGQTFALTPRTGEIYAHIFENPRAKVRRALFWMLNLDLDPVKWDGETWDCSLGIEWIVWPIKCWHDLDGADLDTSLQPESIECSVYVVARHHPAELTRLSMRATSTPKHYVLDVEGLAEIDLDGEAVETSFSFSCGIEFTGVVVVPENLFPKPVTSTEMKAVLNEFLSLDGLSEPRHEGFRYLFVPRP